MRGSLSSPDCNKYNTFTKILMKESVDSKIKIFIFFSPRKSLQFLHDIEIQHD